MSKRFRDAICVRTETGRLRRRRKIVVTLILVTYWGGFTVTAKALSDGGIQVAVLRL
jgi:hypothetical protein